MLRLNLTLPMPAENVALDEALLESAEAGAPDAEYLRLWESTVPMVVVGRSSRVGQEVNLAACENHQVPILRRSSGGAAIVAGPGCLMFAVVLSYRLRPQLRDIRRAHCEILGRLADTLHPHLAKLGHAIVQAGTSDLAIDQRAGSRAPGSLRKFSGNSLRAKRTHLLYHGTLLYDFDLTLIETYLQQPPRQPEYRAARPHRDFVTNLPLARETLIEAIDGAWPTDSALRNWPQDWVARLVQDRFGRRDWNLEFP
jgi:lipoate-protein ligase A